jgi:branched-chain amino acid transport system ATP-binding protein
MTTGPASGDALLAVEHLQVNYGQVAAITDVAIEAQRGRIVTVIGPNGAGKTTMLGAIMGLLPSTGQIAFDGRVISGAGADFDVEARVGLGIVLVPEKRELFGEMDVEDNLMLGGFSRYRRGARDLAASLDEVFALFPRLKERRRQAAGTLSGGERQMLAIGRALMAKPTLLMLDEPSLGLAPLIVREVFQIIAELRRRGVSILLVEQNARAALQVADHAYVLETGRVTLSGPAAEIAKDRRVIDAYLGLG